MLCMCVSGRISLRVGFHLAKMPRSDSVAEGKELGLEGFLSSPLSLMETAQMMGRH